MQENRELLQGLARERREREVPTVKPLLPESCAGMELLRSVSVSFTNSSGKATYVKVSQRVVVYSTHVNPEIKPYPHFRTHTEYTTRKLTVCLMFICMNCTYM